MEIKEGLHRGIGLGRVLGMSNLGTHEVRMAGESISCRGASVNWQDVFRDNEKTSLTDLEVSYRRALF